jgi:resuscitation-promoting factor RpfB
MRLYHSRLRLSLQEWPRWDSKGLSNYPKWVSFRLTIVILLAALSLMGCSPVSANPETTAQIHVTIISDGRESLVDLTPGSTVDAALSVAGLSLGNLDRTDPPLFTILEDGARIKLTRVREEFDIEQVVIPFENQVLRNESLPEGQKRLLQPGENGLQEITYHRVFEDGVETLYSPIKTVVLREAVPEILMIGSQAPFTSIPIPGRLAYLLAGNAWVMEGSTGKRRPVITSADLDGRIFSLSPDGKWLLFTRLSQEEENINELWAARVAEDMDSEELVVDLGARNIIHYAEWRPGITYTIAYSTVEPRSSPPGWQANNDLNLVRLTENGGIRPLEVEIETNMGGSYGWWGMTYAWSPDGEGMAYARPDSIGLVVLGGDAVVPLMDVLTLLTGSDWAWVPALAWSPDGMVLYTIDHVAVGGSVSPEESPVFDLTAIPLVGGAPVKLVSQSGMFSNPLPSPLRSLSSGENHYQIAYLQSIFPTQSDNSRYRLAVMDRDGSDRRILFPAEGSPGLIPQSGWGAWSPEKMEGSDSYHLAIIYQNNLWMVDVDSGEARQITGDDLVSRVDWK